jgi:surfeit locus 1 family protein
VKGIIRRSQTQPTFLGAVDPTLAPGQTRLDVWDMVNVARIQQQVNLELLPIYIQEAPDPSWTGLPYRSVSMPDLSDGPHLSYAIQWFLFATMAGAGYPFLVRRSLKKKKI